MSSILTAFLPSPLTINPGKANFDGVTAELCSAQKKTPHAIETGTCFPITDKKKAGDNYEFTLDKGKELTPGENYLFCMRNNTRLPYCVRFSVPAPFFTFKTRDWDPGDSGHPKDPDPYFWTPLSNGTEVAVFGVVDQEMREHVGQLNFVWNNTKPDYRTEVLVIDPVVALTQLLQRFALDHPNFTGLKVLLAQMSAPRAKQLAAQLSGQFNVIISEAQLEHATPDQTVVMNADKPAAKPISDASRRSTPLFLAVPLPYYNPETGTRTVQVRNLTIRHQSGRQRWKFSLKGADSIATPVKDPEPCRKLTDLVVKAAESLAPTGNYKEDAREAFRVLTLHNVNLKFSSTRTKCNSKASGRLKPL